jgi:hypothetical protein
MGTVQATLKRSPTQTQVQARKRPGRKRTARKVSAAELRELLDQTLSDVDADDRAGPLLRAAGLRVRFWFPDLDLVLNIAPSEEGKHHLRWTFSDHRAWEPKLDLVMDSEVANAYLQGQESLAIAIARGRMRWKGETRLALLYVPALRLLGDAYRRLVRQRYPRLALG